MTAWTPEQDRCLRAVDEWFKHHSMEQPVFRVFGYAGSGKTTLAKHFRESVNGDVAFAAYTGKAASVLRAKGCEGASTIHKLIYSAIAKSKVRLRALEEELDDLKNETRVAGPSRDEQVRIDNLEKGIAEEKDQLKRPAFEKSGSDDIASAELIIIDECSMVDDRVGNDLLSFNKPILVLGDPGQLPPVARDAGFFTNAEPDVMLTEIHRQARDNPILELATDVRLGRSLPLGSYGESEVVRMRDLSPERLMATNQVLVGRNTTRQWMNGRFRERLGRASWIPEPGDRLVCLRNNHDVGLLNGTIWNVNTIAPPLPDAEVVFLGVASDDDNQTIDTTAWADHLRGEKNDRDWFERLSYDEFAYGYALTCHKAQGSQWDDVVVLDESHIFRRDAKRWLYTAITRAAERITIAR